MAAISGSVQPGSHAGTEPWAVVVKNTFISIADEVKEEPRVSGRPSSLPPSLRLSGVRGPPASQRPCRGQRRRARAGKALGEEDASTEAESPRGEEDASTEAGTSVEEEQSSIDVETLDPELPGAARGAVAAAGAAAAEGGGNVLEKVFGGQPSSAKGGGAAPRLNAAAPAWTPSAALVAPPSEAGRRFHLQLERIVQAVRAILMGCAFIVGTDASRVTLGWTISVQIRKEEFHCKELVLTRAKEAFLMAAEASENVYVLGYLARPFVPTLGGFSARFAAVPDNHKACWGLLKNGVCQYGNNCRWEHPECQATVSVLALLAS